MRDHHYQAIVMGASAGGMEALLVVLSELPATFGLPILVVQHLHPLERGAFARQLDNMLELKITTARDKERIESGRVYFSPANYHMLVEKGETIALSVDEKVNWTRPAIDVLFESAARVWRQSLVGIILTGANSDGAAGMRCIAEHGGLAIVQDPLTAFSPEMPQACIQATSNELVLSLPEIGDFLQSLDPVEGLPNRDNKEVL